MQLLEVVSATVMFGFSAAAALQITAQGAGAVASDEARRQELDGLEAALVLAQAVLERQQPQPALPCSAASQMLAASLTAIALPPSIQLGAVVQADGSTLLLQASGSQWRRQRLVSAPALGWCLQEAAPPVGAVVELQS